MPAGSPHRIGYLELAPGRTIRYDAHFYDPNLPGVMQTTITLKEVLCGTEISIVQEGLPSVIPVEMGTLGWQASLEQLAQLVTPNIPD